MGTNGAYVGTLWPVWLGDDMVDIRLTTVTLTRAQFDALPEHSLLALRAGKTVTIGNRWKRREGDRWYMAEVIDGGGFPEIVISEIVIEATEASG